MKKLLSFLLVCAMALGLCAGAFADGEQVVISISTERTVIGDSPISEVKYYLNTSASTNGVYVLTFNWTYDNRFIEQCTKAGDQSTDGNAVWATWLSRADNGGYRPAVDQLPSTIADGSSDHMVTRQFTVDFGHGLKTNGDLLLCTMYFHPADDSTTEKVDIPLNYINVNPTDDTEEAAHLRISGSVRAWADISGQHEDSTLVNAGGLLFVGAVGPGPFVHEPEDPDDPVTPTYPPAGPDDIVKGVLYHVDAVDPGLDAEGNPYDGHPEYWYVLDPNVGDTDANAPAVYYYTEDPTDGVDPSDPGTGNTPGFGPYTWDQADDWKNPYTKENTPAQGWPDDINDVYKKSGGGGSDGNTWYAVGNVNWDFSNGQQLINEFDVAVLSFYLNELTATSTNTAIQTKASVQTANSIYLGETQTAANTHPFAYVLAAYGLRNNEYGEGRAPTQADLGNLRTAVQTNEVRANDYVSVFSDYSTNTQLQTALKTAYNAIHPATGS